MFSTELKIFMRVVPLYLAVSAIEFGNPVVKRVQQFRILSWQPRFRSGKGTLHRTITLRGTPF